jgi:charged multivesicular body protein 7
VFTYVDHIYSPETFARTFSDLFPRPLSKLDLLIILKYLSRDKKDVACSPTVNPLILFLIQAIKFRSSNKPLTPISESDTAIAELKKTQFSLKEQITLLTTQSEVYTEKAREATQKKNRILALSALRSRKLTESALQKRSDALARIEEVLGGVEQAASDVEVLKSLEGGATALERLNKDIGGIEKVERVMDRVREGVELSEDVGKVIAEMGSSKVDEEEVQEEFDEMLKAEEEQKKREQEERDKKEAQDKACLEAKRDKILVDELQSVSLNPPKEDVKMPDGGVSEPIPG